MIEVGRNLLKVIRLFCMLRRHWISCAEFGVGTLLLYVYPVIGSCILVYECRLYDNNSEPDAWRSGNSCT